MDLGDIEKLTAKHITAFVAAFVGGVVPGLIAIYFFKPAWIAEFGVAKLILCSAAITMPVFFMNCLMTESFSDRTEMYWDARTLMPGIIVTGIFCLTPLFFMYSYPSIRSFKNFVALLVVIEGLVAGGATIIQVRAKGFSALFGGEETDISKAVKKIIDRKHPGEEFDSHNVIEILMTKYSTAYDIYMRDRRTSPQTVAAAHGQIAQMISEYKGVLVEHIGKTSSQTINGTSGECALWRKRETPE